MFRWFDHSHHRHRLLGLALLALQAALMLPGGDSFQTTLVLTHFALILLWQPFFEGSAELVSYRNGIATIGLAVAVVLWSSWLLLAVWLLILIGLLGGELTVQRRDQIVQGAVILYLLIALLGGVTPALFRFDSAADSAVTWLVNAAGLIPAALLAVRAGPLPLAGQRFDYVRTVTITAVALTLWAGAALWTYRSGHAYPVALLQSVLFVGGLLLLLNWLWRRHADHTLFEVLWKRYLLNLGTPFEHYLVSLTGPAARSLEPDSYLDQVMASLSNLDWVAGVEARGPAGERLTGERTGHATEVHDDTVPLIVYTPRAPGPALKLHIQLLARLVQQLYLSRVREAELRHQEKARAVYETGARLTHDIKNLLQSLQSLAGAVSSHPADRPEQTLQLVQRQLPQINERLQGTLDKLYEPGEVQLDATVSARRWWEELRARYADSEVRFQARIEGSSEVPRELFDTVAENLVENARHKQARDPDVAITVLFEADGQSQRLQVCDTGAPMPEHMERSFLPGAGGSASGLGLGLYQCARLAEQLGYALTVAANDPARVCLALAPQNANT